MFLRLLHRNCFSFLINYTIAPGAAELNEGLRNYTPTTEDLNRQQV